ncbi:hypothetical protein E2I00_001825 [Balaenoptera physalus]|uniref:Uncharacterized protein n=1 Tax=Balaenoptera physalus TaxID=9770 RepID=A0A643BNP0_BALPH|nr:hypothetical protein E2I00_001825 [Balaenoptera physalus]
MAAAEIGGEVALAAAEAFFALRTPSFSLLRTSPDIYSEKTLTLGGSERGRLVRRNKLASNLDGKMD